MWNCGRLVLSMGVSQQLNMPSCLKGIETIWRAARRATETGRSADVCGYTEYIHLVRDLWDIAKMGK